MSVTIAGERLRSRRVDLGLSPARLGRLVNKTGKCIRRLEEGLSSEGLVLRELNTIADALGVDAAWLLASEHAETSPAQDSLTARVGALLANEPEGVDTSVLCVMCNVTMDVIHEVLVDLDERLEAVGQRLAVAGTRARVVPAALDPYERQQLALSTHDGRVLRSDEATLLLRIARGEMVREPDRFTATGRTLGRLETLGLVVYPDADERAGRRPALSDDVSYSLLVGANAPRA